MIMVVTWFCACLLASIGVVVERCVHLLFSFPGVYGALQIWRIYVSSI